MAFQDLFLELQVGDLGVDGFEAVARLEPTFGEEERFEEVGFGECLGRGDHGVGLSQS